MNNARKFVCAQVLTSFLVYVRTYSIVFTISGSSILHSPLLIDKTRFLLARQVAIISAKTCLAMVKGGPSLYSSTPAPLKIRRFDFEHVDLSLLL